MFITASNAARFPNYPRYIPGQRLTSTSISTQLIQPPLGVPGIRIPTHVQSSTTPAVLKIRRIGFKPTDLNSRSPPSWVFSTAYSSFHASFSAKSNKQSAQLLDQQSPWDSFLPALGNPKKPWAHNGLDLSLVPKYNNLTE